MAAMKPAFFVAAARSALMVVGAPSYASGIHMWKGTMDILKPKPATKSRVATPARADGWLVNPATTADIWVLPVRP